MERQCGGFHWSSGITPSSSPWGKMCCPRYSWATGWAAGTAMPEWHSAQEPWRTRLSSVTCSAGSPRSDSSAASD
eukprot:13105813-Heterocapsa_arctica.AAC.1